MNTLHMHHDYIISKLDELIDLAKQPAANPKSDLFYAIITLIVCFTIVFVAYYAIKKFFDWKKTVQEKEIDQKDKERLNRVKDKEFELKKEYQSKIIDYLKEEANSYSKLLKELDKKKKEKAERFKEINVAIESVTSKLSERYPDDISTYTLLFQELFSIKEKLNELEAPVTTEATDWNDWNKFHDSLKQSEYLKALTYFLEGDAQDKEKALFDYLTSQRSK